ncbi:MAG: nitrous oxide-stimulated promoter family protein [Geobacteraceae bacterium]|nr:nitrous oxide-stimulated promoter family protein [Geobacteraceae bacterium]
MVEIYCRGRHRTGNGICEECRWLLDYAMERIERCPYRSRKPACSECSVHCYRADWREQIRRVMRYAGPRIALRHPVLALLHLADRLRGSRGVTPPKRGEAGL